MADEPKPDTNPPAPNASGAPAAPGVTSPSPAEAAGDQAPGKDGPNPPAKAAGRIQAEALSDGTIPVVLNEGETHRHIAKGKASLTTVYRKADILTTLFTFAGALVAAVIVLGVYAYFTGSKTKAPTIAPKVATLDKSQLDKLNAFFTGNSAGNPAQVLTISSSSLFNSRVAINSDLKVIGGVDVSGTTTLKNLSATGTTTLGVTNVGGQLSINGPLTVQNPALFNAGASFKGNLIASGNGTFTGSLSAGSLTVQSLSVSGTLNLNGHLNLGGSTPSASPASSYASSASVSGNDSGGTVTVNMPPVGNSQALSGADLVTVTFHTSYPNTPTVVITPDGRGGAMFMPYVLKSATGFTIAASTVPLNGNATSYSFDYWVVQ